MTEIIAKAILDHLAARIADPSPDNYPWRKSYFEVGRFATTFVSELPRPNQKLKVKIVRRIKFSAGVTKPVFRRFITRTNSHIHIRV